MQNSGTINLSSQRISFVNKISLILKATSDDESATPGYLYREINDISFESAGYSESLVEFLTDRLKSSSCNVKFKVLKLMKHVAENGSREFKLGIRRHSSAIQECTKFGGPPHPLHGNTPYLMVRKIAREVCEELYSMEPEVVRSPANMAEVEKPAELKYGGLGPVTPGGNIQGFGNTPTSKSKSFSETLLGGLEKLGAKMTETASTRQAALLANLDMSGSTRNYQPPALPASLRRDIDESNSPVTMREQNKSLVVVPKTQARRPTPGKAGGGWGDDDDEDDDKNDNVDNCSGRNILSEKRSSLDTDSRAELTSGGPPAGESSADTGLQADWTKEQELLETVLAKGSTGPSGELLAPSEITAFTDQAASLCCPLLVEFLGQKLAQPHHGLALRALQLLEGLLYSNEELVPADNVVSLCQGPLIDCFTTSQTNVRALRTNPPARQDSPSSIQPDHQGGGTERTETGGEESENQDRCLQDYASLVHALYAKSAKLILALQQLSSFSEIIPASQFSGFLPAV